MAQLHQGRSDQSTARQAPYQRKGVGIMGFWALSWVWAFSIGFLLLFVRSWNFRMRKRAEKEATRLADQAEEQRRQRIDEARLPEQRVQVSAAGHSEYTSEGLTGSLMLVGSGTYGLNMVFRLLFLLSMCGLERLVGSILIIEHDTDLRDAFPSRINPVFRDRVVYGFSPTWNGGFANKSVDYVMKRIEKWGGPLKAAAEQVAELHERWTFRPPGQIVWFGSLGGQAPTALPVLDILSKKFDEVQIVGMTSLPSELRNRQKFVQLKPKYDEYVDGWVVADRTLAGWENADYCMAALVVAPADAQQSDDVTTQFKNMLALAFTEQPGSMLAVQSVHEELPSFAWDVEGERLGYFIDKYRVVDAVQNALHQIEQGNGTSSVRAPIGEPDTSVFDIVMCPLGDDKRHQRNDMQVLSDAIHAGYALRLKSPEARLPGMFYGLVNYELKFGKIAEAINPHRPTFRIVAMRLAAVKNSQNIAEELIKVPDELLLPYERSDHQLSDSKVRRIVPSNGNGVRA